MKQNIKAVRYYTYHLGYNSTFYNISLLRPERNTMHIHQMTIDASLGMEIFCEFSLSRCLVYSWINPFSLQTLLGMSSFLALYHCFSPCHLLPSSVYGYPIRLFFPHKALHDPTSSSLLNTCLYNPSLYVLTLFPVVEWVMGFIIQVGTTPGKGGYMIMILIMTLNKLF